MKSILNKLALFTLLSLVFSLATLAQSLPEGKWNLVKYSFKEKVDYPISKDEITLNIHSDGNLGGKSGCNVYGGSWATEDGKTRIFDLISTKMFCGGPSNLFEMEFLATLTAATEFKTSADELTITDPKTKNFLRFERAIPNHKCRPGTKCGS